MASEQVVPIEALLDPISEDSPAGVDIRQSDALDSNYQNAREARSAARAAERQNLLERKNSDAEAQWRKIIELAPKILQNEAKDLEVACWYSEALLRIYGFQGLRDGFTLVQGLIENYWDGLYPLPDEDGMETRVAYLSGLNGEGVDGVLIAPIRNVDITEGSEPGPFSFWQYQQAPDTEKTLDEEALEEMVSKLGFSNADVERAVTDSSEGFFVDLIDDLQQTVISYREVSRLLDEHCGAQDAPPTSNIISTLEECLGAARHISRHKLPQPQAPSESEVPEKAGETVAAVAGSLTSREEAFRRLSEISIFFRKTEPHSPISYILERAVKWGELPLEDLMRELIPDNSARDFYGSLTGIKTDND